MTLKFMADTIFNKVVGTLTLKIDVTSQSGSCVPKGEYDVIRERSGGYHLQGQHHIVMLQGSSQEDFATFVQRNLAVLSYESLEG